MTAISSQASAFRGIRQLAARRPVVAFLALVFSIGYPAMLLSIALTGSALPTLLVGEAVMLSSALWVTWAVDGAPGVHRLLRRMIRWRIGVGWWVTVVVATPALTLALALVLGDSLRPFGSGTQVLGQLAGFAVAVLVFNLWEETAWAGVMQTRLERGHGLVVGALLTSVAFAFMHVPAEFIGEFSAASVLGTLIGLLIFAPLIRLTFAVVMRGTRDSVFAVALMHAAFNRSNQEDGLIAGLVDGEMFKLAVLLTTVVVGASAAIVIGRVRLSRAHRLVLDSTPAWA